MNENNNKEGEAENRLKLLKPLHFLYAAVLVLSFLCAFYLRHKYLNQFSFIFTIDFNGNTLFRDILNEKQFLIVLLKFFCFKLFMGYFLGLLLCLLSAAALYGILKDLLLSKSLLDLLEDGNEKARKYLVIGSASVIVLLMVFVHFHYLYGLTISTDEFSYLFQANLLKDFKLSAPAPEFPEFYSFSNIIIHNGKWFSKYTLGFPLFLSTGTFIGAPWIVNPLLSILAAFFIFRITKLLFSDKAAVVSVFLAFLSPFFFFNGAAAFQPHMAVACSLLGSAYYYFLTVKAENFKWHYTLLCAIFFTLGAFTRPVDSAIWEEHFSFCPYSS